MNNISRLSIMVLVACLMLINITAYGQAKVRLSADYIKKMGESGQIDIKARAKIDGKMQAVQQVEFQVLRWYEDTTFLLGTIKTNGEGRASFNIASDKSETLDTTGISNYQILLEGHEEFKDLERIVSFQESNLEADLTLIDSVPHIEISYTDAKGVGIVEQGIMLTVDRLFKPYTIGDELYYTEDDGTLLIPYEDNLPGINNALEFIITTEEGDDYGTVYTTVSTNLGTDVELESSYDERTMWSPPNKTPWVLLIFPNLIIIGVWLTLIRLVRNLYKISKS